MEKAIIFCAPSGSGKTTIVKHLLQKFDNLGFSISACTRDRRGRAEVHGKDYYFLSIEEFQAHIEKDNFVEWEKKRKLAPNIHHFKAALKKMEHYEMHNIHKKHKYVDVNDMQLSDKLIQKITNRFAKYIIDNPLKAEEISKLMHEILVEQPKNEFNEKH